MLNGLMTAILVVMNVMGMSQEMPVMEIVTVTDYGTKTGAVYQTIEVSGEETRENRTDFVLDEEGERVYGETTTRVRNWETGEWTELE